MAALVTAAAGSLAVIPAASADSVSAAQPTAQHAVAHVGNLTAPAVTPAVKAKLAAGRSICYAAHVQNIGWQSWVCDGQIAGTTGQSLRMEALAIITSGTGGICAQAHVQNIGWMGVDCEPDGSEALVGTTGESLRMEALFLAPNTSPGSICADAHVQNIGWQGVVCNDGAWGGLEVGTTGQSLRMEAITITV
jgi:uncharacterized protein YjdB